MSPDREHRSERPAVWDYSNPTAELRLSLRRRIGLRDAEAQGKNPKKPSAKTNAPRPRGSAADSEG